MKVSPSIDTSFKECLATVSAVPWINSRAIPNDFVTYFIVGAFSGRITSSLIQHAVFQPFYAHALGLFIGMALIYSLKILLQDEYKPKETHSNDNMLDFSNCTPVRYFLGHFFAYYAPFPVLAFVSAAFISGPLILRLSKGIAVMAFSEK